MSVHCPFTSLQIEVQETSDHQLRVAILVQQAARYPVVVVDELLNRPGVVEPVVHPRHVRTIMSIAAGNERVGFVDDENTSWPAPKV